MVDYLEEVKKIIEDQFGIPAEDIEEETHLESDLNLTELDIEDLVATLGEKYQVKIPEDKISSFKKISDLTAYLFENVDTA